jgi:hypothetical protein
MMVTLASRDLRRLASVSIAVAVWGLGYALYRGYYALGGTLLLPGTPADPTQFRLINAAAVAVLAIAAVLPIAMLPLWRRPRARQVLLAVCWLVAVGCSMHALIDSVQRVLSLAGLLRIEYSAAVWASINHRAADPAGPVLQRAMVPARGARVRGARMDRLGPRSPPAMVGRQRDHRDLGADRDRAALGDRRHRESDHRLTAQHA